MTPRGGEVGTVLVEALVAVLIVAGMAGLWFQTLGQSAMQQRLLAERRTAMLIAQSQLATVGATTPVSPGSTNGQDGDYGWVIEIARTPAGADQVNVSVSDSGGKPLATLQTLRFGR